MLLYGSKQENLLKKRRYHGKTGGGSPSKKQSKSPVSVRKVETIRKHSAGDIQGYRLLDITILKNILMGLSCPECFEVGSLSLEEDYDRKNGLTSLLIITCECGYEKEAYTSRTVNKRLSDETRNDAGAKAYEINCRAVYGMHTLGKIM